jgi:hypothetical protein
LIKYDASTAKGSVDQKYIHFADAQPSRAGVGEFMSIADVVL